MTTIDCSTVVGRTLNPYDSRRSAGGSSGGEGAMLGAAASVIGVGTDIGGSARNPAMFCGVFGLKPGPRLTKLDGMIPDCALGYHSEMVAIGPMTRYARDLVPMLKLVVDAEHLDFLQLDQHVDVSQLRVFHMDAPRSLLLQPLDNDVQATFDKTVAHLETIVKMPTRRIDLPLARYAVDMWLLGFVEQSAMPLPHYFTGFSYEKRVNGLAELPKWFAGRSDHLLSTIIFCLAYDFFASFEYDGTRRRQMRSQLRNELVELLGNDGVLVYPSFPRATYFHNEALAFIFDTQLVAIWNALGFAALAVPMGFNADGLPTSVQIVAPPGGERLIIAVGAELERKFGGWQPPRAPQ